MKANELMIGDWVRFPNMNGRVAELKDQFCEFKPLSHATYDLVEPIPLTSEILGKNGFISYPQDRIVIWRNDYSFAIECDLTTWEYYWANGDVKINYVHELQRVLRCCGLWDLANNFVV